MYVTTSIFVLKRKKNIVGTNNDHNFDYIHYLFLSMYVSKN